MHIIDELYSSCPDLSETPLSDPEEEWYTDSSSFAEKGERKAGYAVVSLEETKESGSLPPDTSAQKTEPFALTRALELREGKRINAYMTFLHPACPCSNLEGKRDAQCLKLSC